MREIECVKLKSTSLLMDQYLKKLIEEAKLEAKFLTWDEPHFKTKTPLILVVDTEHLPNLKKALAERNEKIIIALNTRKDFKIVTELANHFAKIFGFIDLSQEIDYNVPLIKNYMAMHFEKSALKLDKLATDLEKVYEYTKSQLVKIKDLHDRFVKVRVDKLKGVTLTSKFMAGEKSGGEFFEIIQNDQELLFIQAGSDSYLLSSMILAEIEILKEKSGSQNLSLEVEKFQKLISHHAHENKAELTFCIMTLNLKTLVATFALSGLGHIYFQGHFLSFEKPIRLKLKPKDRFSLVSQGALKNWEILNPELTPKKFFVTNEGMVTKDLINEFFFEVSRNKSGNFLIYDAFMATIDIEENAIYQLT